MVVLREEVAAGTDISGVCLQGEMATAPDQEMLRLIEEGAPPRRAG